ncbi:MAG: hypothetical protein K6F35_02770 [Lachnospiraceae bacterium]|nr:hypothetical protein [Lachnospiraceae bacterium]
MFQLWAKEWKNNKMLRDIVISDASEDTRTHKVFHTLEQVCLSFDLSTPIWLAANVSEFKKHSKTRFYSDSFIDEIPFDYLEISVLEED